MSFPAYPEYKDSGVPWLGGVPESWELVRFKNLLRERDQRSTDGSEELLSVSAYTGVRPKSESTADGEFASRAESLEGYKVCKQTDLVMNIMLAWNRGLGVTQFDGIVSPAYCVFALGEKLRPAFFDYAVRADEYTGYFKAHSSGVIDSRLRLYPDKFGALSFAKPPLEEQEAIAAFLDRETAKIDALVAEQERLIALLKEKRQAVISQAVTKGLDPDAPMKDSGIEWLGEIPAHWEVRRIKHLSTRISKGTTPTTVGGDFTSSGIRFLKAENIYDGAVLSEPQFFIDEETHQALSRSELAEHDVLVVIAGATTGKSAVLSADLLPANTNQAVSFVRCAALQHAQLVHNWLSTSIVQTQILLTSVQSAQPNLSMEDLGNLPIAVPTSSECASLSSFVSEIDESYGRLIGEATGAMRLLRERRAALISAAVTGKIDVRGLVEQHETEAA